VVELTDEEAAYVLASNPEIRHEWTRWMGMSGQARLPMRRNGARFSLSNLEVKQLVSSGNRTREGSYWWATDNPARRLSRKERHRPGGGHAVSVSQPYQSAWTAVPLCSVVTVPLALHAITADRSDQLSIPSCQCLAIPAGDS
jgi:hypothetical protein